MLGYILFPLLSLFYQNKQTRILMAQRLIHYSFKCFLAIMHLLGVARFELRGFEKLMDDKGVLFVANHPSLLDYVMIVSRLEYCDNIVKASLWQNRYIKNVIQTAGYIPNIKGDQTFELIKNRLSGGHNLLLFPEGTRSTPNQALEIKRGAAQIAIRAEVSIRLIHISVSPTTLTKGEKWYEVPRQKPCFRVVIGDRLTPNDYILKYKRPSLAARAMTRDIHKALSKKDSQ
ncbi:MAG: lysophospholipid acyltransferase family protein [Francisellaceae bacterium]